MACQNVVETAIDEAHIVAVPQGRPEDTYGKT